MKVSPFYADTAIHSGEKFSRLMNNDYICDNKNTKQMNKLEILNRHLSGKSKLLLAIFFLMALGLITFLISPFLLIWVSWSLAWRVGATGLCATIVLFTGWWFLYNSFWTTIDSIRHE